MEAGTQSDKLHEIFIQNVSHELRTPLAIMLGFTQLLKDGDFGELAPEQEEATKVILDRAESLKGLVERICLLMGGEGHEVIRAPLSLAEVVKEVVTKKETEIETAGLSLSVEMDDNLPIIFGNQYRLGHLVTCLLDNAVKFNEAEGTIKLKLYAEHDQLCLSVTDSGIGIPAAELKQLISNRFYQIDGSTTRNYEGLGLGLTLVKAIVEEHNGRLEINSEPGFGSQFIVQLPVPVTPAGESVSVTHANLPPQRVLVVDDEINVGLIVQKGLKKLPNCEIKLARNADQALALCQEGPFDLMITDYMMPGTDGLALAGQIRELYPQTVILMLTAHNNDELHQQASQVSIQRIMNKPVEITEIRQAVSQVLDNGPSA
ncbi:ATP-binding protein [Candidatus Leptofilum sp.]|uniref:hybrid sensor histidine kinase/response regulator n=1 Tax=Candidatus Leptofilum sp. TaxID=3241576 RepID=UPI003B5AAC54